jgi:Ca-activated chloride channel family protein
MKPERPAETHNTMNTTPNTAAVTPSLQPKLLITPLRPAVPAEGGAIEVLVRVQAPEQPAGSEPRARTPLRLVLVVDRSGSMAGEPLAEALRCVEHIGSCLQPEDHLAVVLYDDHIQVPMHLTRSPGAQVVAAVLAGIDSGGSTNLHLGWETGARELVAGTAQSISRVVLLSDGQANQGHCDPAYLAGQCSQWLQKGVSTTTVGLGRAFNEELMIAMARAGGGQQYYGQRAEDLFDAFDGELSLLQAMMLRNIRARAIPAPGVLVQPLGAVTADADGWLPMSELAWGAESWMLLRLHIAAQTPVQAGTNPPEQRMLLGLSVTGQGMEGADITIHAAPLALPVLAAADFAALPADETVQRRLQELGFADLTQQVRQLLQQGRDREARELLRRAEIQVADHPWLAAKLEQLRSLTERDQVMAAKEMSYNSMRMRSRLVSAREDMSVADETDNVEVPAFLRRKSSEGTGRRRS